MQRSERSFIKNGKESKDRNVLLKRTDAQPWQNLTQLAVILKYKGNFSDYAQCTSQQKFFVFILHFIFENYKYITLQTFWFVMVVS